MIESNKAIYLVITDRITDDILSGNLTADQRLLSIREYAAEAQVNPNTVMRAYDLLSREGIIYNRRGVGYFLSPDAREIVAAKRRKALMDGGFDGFFRSISLLDVTPDELRQAYADYLRKTAHGNE